MKNWTIASLKDDGIPEDSVFFEYLGRMREIEDTLREIENKYGNNKKIGATIDKLIYYPYTLNDIRFNYYSLLSSNNRELNLSAGDTRNLTYSEISKKMDETTQAIVNEFYSLIENDRLEDAKTVAKFLEDKFKRILNVDKFILEKAEKELNPKAEKSSKKIKEEIEKTKEDSHQDFDRKEYFDPDTFAPNPLPLGTAYTTIRNTYTTINNNSYIQNNISIEQPHENVYRQSYHRKYRSVKRRNRTKRRLILLGMATVAATVALFANANKKDNKLNVYTTPKSTPVTTDVIQPEQTQFADSQIEKIASSPTFSEQVPNTYQAETTSNKTYKKGTLSYSLEYMDDEMISVVAESLRNSVGGLNQKQIDMYGNGCNKEYTDDRELVASVFETLDSRAKNVNTNNLDSDKYGIALQVKQLSGDITKYLVARSLNESENYTGNDYTPDIIDIYYTINKNTDVATNFDVRVVNDAHTDVKQLISREYSTKGVLNSLIRSYATLDNALEKTAFGTQEGHIIDTYSMQAYNALATILSNDLNIKVNTPGKGISISTVENDIDI